MEITSGQVAYKKRIGKIGTQPVFEVGLIGGLHLVVMPQDGKVKTLGAGSHRAVARFMAKRENEGLEIDELEKGDFIEPATFAHQLPRYELMVRQLNEAAGVK